MPCRRENAGFTLLELLIVLAVIGILAGALLPHGNPNIIEHLRSTAQIVSAELAYGRSLAMLNNSTYKFTFEIAQNRFILRHSGTNPSLNKLPASPFRSPGDAPDQHVVSLNDIPHLGHGAQIAAVTTAGASQQNINDIEFNPLGATTRSNGAVVWLVAGGEANARYLPISVDPITGLCQVGIYCLTGPQ